MLAETDNSRAERLLELLRSEDPPTIQELSDRLGIGYQSLYKALLAAGYEPKRRHSMLSAEQNRQIERMLLRTNHSQRKIARILGVAYSTVQLRSKRLRRRAVRGAETELRLVDRDAHCPKHGKLTVWPCVACAAEAARRGKKLKVRRRTAAMG